MYSVFIVEDEIVVREGIRNNIPWESTPYTLAGEAPDGEMALSILKDVKPDILVTDIRMPFMDGLALARIVKKTQPWVKIIILSGHDEFQYAREAISIGVEEYLLKPVSAQDMLQSLDKVAARIEEEKKRLNSMEDLRQQVHSTADVLREQWLWSLVTGSLPAGDAIEQARSYGIDLIARSYTIMVAGIDTGEGQFGELAIAKRVILANLQTRSDVIVFSQGVDRLGFIVKETGQDSLEETVYTLAQGVKFEAERNTACFISVGIGSSVERIGELSQSYEGAVRVLKYLATTGRREIIGVNDMRSSGGIDFHKLGADPVANKLRYVARDEIDCFVDQYMELFGDRQNQTSFIGYYLLYDVIVAACSIIEELHGDVHLIFPASFRHELIVEIAGSRERFRAEVKRIVEAVVCFRESKVDARYDGIISKAKRYIDENFADPDISLHSVAAFVNMSPNHFSTVFSQEAGESFIEFLTCARIDHAKKLLLTTPMKGADIAYEAGFNDPHYFSFIFKKNVGVSPRDFRSEKNVHSGEESTPR
jgi:two-component system response regulator YesN